MKYLRTLCIALVVLLTGCGIIFKENLIANPSEDMLVLCGRVDHRAPIDMGEAITNYDQLLDQYTECRLTHNALVEYHRKRKQ